MPNIKMIPGIENALKMREMFLSEGFRCHFICHHQIPLVRPAAILTIRKGAFLSCYYFNEDGTYYRGPN